MAFLVRMYIIRLDPFLNSWDERFHALVARNLMLNPLKPMLHQQHLMLFNYKGWVFNEVWLHKQPLFMWQMALALKLFGVSEVAVRLPSAIMGALSCSVLYRIALLLWDNRRVAFVSALLLCFSYYHLEMISGHIGMDHNDVSFSCYILLSLWAYLEYLQKQHGRWVLMIGLFAGCAVLTKWLTGIIVFAPWGIQALVDYFETKKIASFKHLLIAFLVCCIVFVPWQLYILYSFPTEAWYEYSFNAKHIMEAVEGHQGGWNFYINRFGDYFGAYIFYLIPLGMLFSFRRFDKLHRSVMIVVCIVFIFFSFLVVSKLPSFFFIAVPFLMLYLAAGFDAALRWFTKSSFIHAILIFPLLWLALNPIQIQENHNPQSEDFLRRERNTKIYKLLAQDFREDIHVINVNTTENIELLFYNQNFQGCDWEMPKDTLKALLDQGVEVVTTKESLDSLNEFTSYPNFHFFNYALDLRKP